MWQSSQSNLSLDFTLWFILCLFQRWSTRIRGRIIVTMRWEAPPTLSLSLSSDSSLRALSCSPTSHEALFSIYRRQKEQFPGYLFVFRDQVHKNNLWLDFDKDLWSWNFFIPSPQQSKTHEMQFGLVLLNRWQVTAERNSCIACLSKIIAINEIQN